ncbi:hypothetical protein ACA373_21415 [Erwinia sp. STN24]|uniref:hypothetical protein n=1 Tax=Erwinia sp. STN24 TaxID=3233996 RepID=UPI003521975A
MANQYPADIYALVVAELICEHFEGQTSLYPEQLDIVSAQAVGVEPYELVNHLTEKLKASGSKVASLCKRDQSVVIDMMINDTRLIINDDYEIQRVRSAVSEEVLGRIDGWRNQYRNTAKNFYVCFTSVNISGENIECETCVKAQSAYDAAFKVGQAFADDNCLITDIKEVEERH